MLTLQRSTPFAFMATLALVVAACGGTAGPSPTTPAVGTGEPTATAGETGGAATGPLACDVVTPAMISSALGVTVGTGTLDTSLISGSTCQYSDAGILVRVFPARDAAFLQSMKGSFSGAVDLPGIGDGAWYSSEHATFMVLKGTTVVEVQAPNQNDQAKLAALAAAIAAAL
jgi:hypothetical protein